MSRDVWSRGPQGRFSCLCITEVVLIDLFSETGLIFRSTPLAPSVVRNIFSADPMHPSGEVYIFRTNIDVT